MTKFVFALTKKISLRNKCVKKASVILSLLLISESISLLYASAVYDPQDSRHQLIRGVYERFGQEIAARRAQLGTYYLSIAMVDFARERLESGKFLSSEPDWANVIRFALLGYGTTQGVVNSKAFAATDVAKPRNADMDIMRRAQSLSSAYLKTRGTANTTQADQVFAPTASSTAADFITMHVQILNQVATSVPKDVYDRMYEFRKEQVTESLSTEMPAHRSLMGRAVEEVSKDQYSDEFVSACHALGNDLHIKDQTEIIPSLAEVEEENYRPFVQACHDLTEGMDSSEKAKTIRAFAEVPEDKHTPAFIEVCRRAFIGVPGKRNYIVSELGRLSADKYTAAFIDACNKLSVGMNGQKKALVIKKLASLSEEKHQVLVDMYLSLILGMNEEMQLRLLGILAAMLAEKNAEEVVEICSRCRTSTSPADILKNLMEHTDRKSRLNL